MTAPIGSPAADTRGLARPEKDIRTCTGPPRHVPAVFAAYIVADGVTQNHWHAATLFRCGRKGLYDEGMPVTRTTPLRPAGVWPRGLAYPVSVALTANGPRARVQPPGRASGSARDVFRARSRCA